jgi:hypothetical protein
MSELKKLVENTNRSLDKLKNPEDFEHYTGPIDHFSPDQAEKYYSNRRLDLHGDFDKFQQRKLLSIISKDVNKLIDFYDQYGIEHTKITPDMFNTIVKGMSNPSTRQEFIDLGLFSQPHNNKNAGHNNKMASMVVKKLFSGRNGDSLAYDFLDKTPHLTPYNFSDEVKEAFREVLGNEQDYAYFFDPNYNPPEEENTGWRPWD